MLPIQTHAFCQRRKTSNEVFNWCFDQNIYIVHCKDQYTVQFEIYLSAFMSCCLALYTLSCTWSTIIVSHLKKIIWMASVTINNIMVYRPYHGKFRKIYNLLPFLFFSFVCVIRFITKGSKLFFVLTRLSPDNRVLLKMIMIDNWGSVHYNTKLKVLNDEDIHWFV